MASRLSEIYGTELDKVHCSFFYKIGACRHGDRCSRKHIRPAFSQTILVHNVWQNPVHNPANKDMTEADIQRVFDDFYEDFFCELVKFGLVEDMVVCDNVGDHLIGNVYALFESEEDAQKAMFNLNQRFYAGRPLYAELSPVTDFREACCRQNDLGTCGRGGFCNFMHVRRINRGLMADLYGAQRLENRLKGREEKKVEDDEVYRPRK